MKPLVIAGVNLRRMVRDRTNLFFVFVLPMILVLLIGLAFGGGFEPTVGVVAEDVGPLGEQLVSRLDDSGELTTRTYAGTGELTDAVARGFADAGVVVPEGFDAAVHAGEVPAVRFVAAPGGAGQTLQATVRAAVDEQARLVTAARFAVEEDAAGGFAAALGQVRRIEALAPAVAVETRIAGEPDPLEEAFAGLDQFDLGASQQLLLFVFLTSLAGSSALIQTRQLGLSRRMLSTHRPVGWGCSSVSGWRRWAAAWRRWRSSRPRCRPSRTSRPTPGRWRGSRSWSAATGPCWTSCRSSACCRGSPPSCWAWRPGVCTGR